MRPGSRGLVLFDLDGTLVDSAPDIAAAANAALAAVGRPPRADELVRRYVGNGAERLIHRCLTGDLHGEAPPALFDACYASFMQHYSAGLCVRTRPYPGVEETLDTLAGRGYGLACVTNKLERFTLPLLAELGLARHFPIVVGGDTLRVRKPDPAPLLHAVKQGGGRVATSVMVGDSLTDVTAARNAGMRMICVTYGYSPNVNLADHAAADALVASMPEILSRLPA